MKIYIYRYGSLCEPDIIESFKHIGLEVYEENTEVYNKKSASVTSRINSIINAGKKKIYAFAFTINLLSMAFQDVCETS